MTVTSDASPLITLARIECLDLLPTLYPRIHISREVYGEIVIAGFGRPGAQQVARAEWIEVTEVRDADAVHRGIEQSGLGAGEVSTIVLARELSAGLVLIDEWKARRYASAEGLSVMGCIRILEILYHRGTLADLRQAYSRLLGNKIRLDLAMLQESLRKFELPPL